LVSRIGIAGGVSISTHPPEAMRAGLLYIDGGSMATLPVFMLIAFFMWSILQK
jgi:hypothetical protein